MKVLGPTSSRPEQYGADVLFYVANKSIRGFAGIQRKELKDFIASVHDGRLTKEVGQMQQLIARLLVLEGKPSWTMDGGLMQDYGYKWNRSQHFGMLWSLQLKGVWVVGTENVDETVEVCRYFQGWLQKDKHTSLSSRPGPVGSWGKPDSRDYAIHVLSSLPGIGPTVAERIVDQMGLPLAWTVTPTELMCIEGIGKKKADAIFATLNYQSKATDSNRKED